MRPARLLLPGEDDLHIEAAAPHPGPAHQAYFLSSHTAVSQLSYFSDVD